MAETNKELLEKIIENEKRLEAKVDKIESALLGDELEGRIGFLKQIANNHDVIGQHEQQLNILNEKIENKAGWKSFAASGVTGLGAGYSVTNWSSLVEWVRHIFNG